MLSGKTNFSIKRYVEMRTFSEPRPISEESHIYNLFFSEQQFQALKSYVIRRIMYGGLDMSKFVCIMKQCLN